MTGRVITRSTAPISRATLPAAASLFRVLVLLRGAEKKRALDREFLKTLFDFAQSSGI
jgi:hypothetical protein